MEWIGVRIARPRTRDRMQILLGPSMSRERSTPDRITLAVFGSALLTVAEEMGAALIRACFAVAPDLVWRGISTRRRYACSLGLNHPQHAPALASRGAERSPTGRRRDSPRCANPRRARAAPVRPPPRTSAIFHWMAAFPQLGHRWSSIKVINLDSETCAALRKRRAAKDRRAERGAGRRLARAARP